jgi:hypothetical protein
MPASRLWQRQTHEECHEIFAVIDMRGCGFIGRGT